MEWTNLSSKMNVKAHIAARAVGECREAFSSWGMGAGALHFWPSLWRQLKTLSEEKMKKEEGIGNPNILLSQVWVSEDVLIPRLHCEGGVFKGEKNCNEIFETCPVINSCIWLTSVSHKQQKTSQKRRCFSPVFEVIRQRLRRYRYYYSLCR